MTAAITTDGSKSAKHSKRKIHSASNASKAVNTTLAAKSIQTTSITEFRIVEIPGSSGIRRTGRRSATNTTARKRRGVNEWLDRLSEMPALPTLADIHAEAAADVRVELSDNRKLTRSIWSQKRRTMNLLHVANAANHLERLPAADEAFHCIVKGNYPQWALVPAILRLAGEPIERLYLVTLGFSKANAQELLDLLDAGQVKNVTALVSCYFKVQDAQIYDPIHEELSKRNHRMLAMRTHAKIILARTKSHSLTIEGSANLRSCRNIEQFTMTNDRSLFDFHAGWIEEVINNARTTANAYHAAERPRKLAG